MAFGAGTGPRRAILKGEHDMTVCHLPGPTMVGPACGQPLPVNGGHRISRIATITCAACLQATEAAAERAEVEAAPG